MVPVYAAGSFLSYLYYRHSVYFETIESCYEAFAIASFFTLLCHYVAEDLHQQKNYFRTIKPKKWVWPMGWIQKCCGGEQGMWRTPRSGLTWFNVRYRLYPWPIGEANSTLGDLGRCLPILLYPSVFHNRGYCDTNFQSLLPVIVESGICPYMDHGI